MYKLYIENYIGASSVSEEALLDSSDVQNSQSDRTILEPTIKMELNKAGSLEFTILPDNPFYSKIRLVKSIISAYMDDVMLFRGRVMTITDDIYGQRQVFCEGELAYLNDSLQSPKKEKETTSAGASAYFVDLIMEHNSQMHLFDRYLDEHEDDKTFGAISNVNGGGMSYQIVSGTGEIVTTDENGNSYIYNRQVSWELGSINLDRNSGQFGENVTNDLRIRFQEAIYMAGGSVISAKEGFQFYIIRYSMTKSPTTNAEQYTCLEAIGPITEKYEVSQSTYIKIVLEKINNTEPFTANDLTDSDNHPSIQSQGIDLSLIKTINTTVNSVELITSPFESSSYRSTFDAIESDLISVYGGYLYVSYEYGDRSVLYQEDPPNSTEQPRTIEIGVNLQELTAERSATELYTVLLPTGDNNLLIKKAEKKPTVKPSTVPGRVVWSLWDTIYNTDSMYVVPQGGLSDYGAIFKTQSFGGIKKRDELKSYADNYVARTYKGVTTAYTIKAVDMHFIDSGKPLILVGANVRLVIGPNRNVELRRCTSATYNLQAPQSCEYVFENMTEEASSLTSRYRKQSSGRNNTNNGVSSTTDTEGSGSEDMILRSNGNIILMPGTDKIVSIPLAKTFLAPELTEWSLGKAVTYKTTEGLKVLNKGEFSNNLWVKGSLSVGPTWGNDIPTSGAIRASSWVYSRSGFRSSRIILGMNENSNPASPDLSVSGVYSIYQPGAQEGEPHQYHPVKLSLIGDKDENNNDTILATAWVIGSDNVNFNIAESPWFKSKIDSAILEGRSSIRMYDATWNEPVVANDNSKAHSKRYTITMSNLLLGYSTTEEEDNGEGSTSPVLVWHLITTQPNLYNPLPADITPVYEFGYTDGWGAAFAKVQWPNSRTSYPYMDVSAPKSTVDADAETKRFRLRDYTDNIIDIVTQDVDENDNITYTTYARYTHGKYDAGKNSVDITGPTWNEVTEDTLPSLRIATFLTDAPTPKSKTLRLHLTTQSTFTNHSKPVYLRPDTASTEAIAQIDIDASTEYFAGQNSVNVDKGQWDSGVCEFTPSAGTGNTGASVDLSISAALGNTPTAELSVLDGTTDTGEKKTLYLKMTNTWVFITNTNDDPVATLNDPDRNVVARASNTAFASGKNSVKITGPTWNEVTGSTLPSLRTATFATDAPTPRSKTLRLHLTTQSTFTNHVKPVYLRPDTASTDAIAQIDIDATTEYTTGKTDGFDICHDSIGLSESSQPLPAGDSVTIYPKAKASVSATSATNITTKGITITAVSDGGIKSTGSWEWDEDDEIISRTITANNNDMVSIGLPVITPTVSATYNQTTHKYDIVYGASALEHSIASGSTSTSTEAYIAGQNSVNVADPTWSNTSTPYSSNTATFSPSPGSGSPKSLVLSLSNSITAKNWNSTTHKYAIGATAIVKDGDNTERLKTVGSDTLTPTEAIEYGESLVAPTGTATISSSTANSSTGRRYSTLYVPYKGPDTATDTATIPDVDVTSIYNLGKSSGQTVSTYNVTFDVPFSDDGTTSYTYNKTKKVTVDCAAIYNQGANDATPSTETRYVHADNGGAVRVRKTASAGGTEIGLLYPRTPVTVIGSEGSFYKITYGGTTGYMSKSFLSTDDNSPTNYGDGQDYMTGWYFVENYVTGVYYTGSSSRIIGEEVYVYYTTGDLIFDRFIVKSSWSECNRTDTNYTSKRDQIKEITSNSQYLDGVSVKVVWDNGYTTTKSVIW